MWNAETAQFLHDWYATPEGTYAITQENRLFQHLISQWPRRGHTLLDIGCGAGIFLEMLWHYGFDVTGLDTGTDLLDMARERLGNRAEFQLGRPEHLPFDDEEFDYAALLTVLEYVDNPEDVLREAIRVSHRGVIIGFMNSFSLYQIQRRLHRPTLEYRHRRHNLNFWSLARMVRRIRPKATLSFRSVLLGPPNTWKKEGLWGKINSLQTPLPIGAYLGLCIDTMPRVPLTPLLLRAKEKAFKVYTGLQPRPAGRGLLPVPDGCPSSWGAPFKERQYSQPKHLRERYGSGKGHSPALCPITAAALLRLKTAITAPSRPSSSSKGFISVFP